MMSRLWRGTKAHATQKLAWHAGVGLWIALCYYPPQWWPWKQAALLPPWLGEDALPFMPAWALVYQSVFLLHTAAFWVGDDMATIRRYGVSIALAFAVGAVLFWCLPAAVARPAHGNNLYRLLITGVDGERNAFPSLHAAMSTLGVIRFWTDAQAIGRGVLATWWAMLLFSTLATRQHRAVDLFAGVLLAAAISRTMPRSTPSPQ